MGLLTEDRYLETSAKLLGWTTGLRLLVCQS